MLNVNACRAVFLALCAIVAAVFFWQSFTIPASTFEPVGGARVPQATAVAILVLCLAAMTVYLRSRAAPARQVTDAKPADWRGFLFVLIFIAYASMLSFRLIGMGWLTAAFLVASQALYSGKRMSAVLILFLVAASFALEVIFTKIFVLDVVTSF